MQYTHPADCRSTTSTLQIQQRICLLLPTPNRWPLSIASTMSYVDVSLSACPALSDFSITVLALLNVTFTFVEVLPEVLFSDNDGTRECLLGTCLISLTRIYGGKACTSLLKHLRIRGRQLLPMISSTGFDTAAYLSCTQSSSHTQLWYFCRIQLEKPNWYTVRIDRVRRSESTLIASVQVLPGLPLFQRYKRTMLLYGHHFMSPQTLRPMRLGISW